MRRERRVEVKVALAWCDFMVSDHTGPGTVRQVPGTDVMRLGRARTTSTAHFTSDFLSSPLTGEPVVCNITVSVTAGLRAHWRSEAH